MERGVEKHTHIWKAAKESSCPEYKAPFSMPARGSMIVGKKIWTKKVEEDDLPRKNPTHIITLKKKGIKAKNEEFGELYGTGPDDESVRVMRMWDVYEMEEKGKSYRLVASFNLSPVSQCRVCGLTLTNEVSVVAGIGPICGKRVGVTAKDERDALEELKKYASKIGYFETYVPKDWIEHIHKIPNDAITRAYHLDPIQCKDFLDNDGIPYPCQTCPHRHGFNCHDPGRGKEPESIQGFWLRFDKAYVPPTVNGCSRYDEEMVEYWESHEP
jgi:hypothetical protein